MPYTISGQLLRVRLTAQSVTIFDGDQVVCEHPRRHGRKGQYSTVLAHAPKQHQGIDGLWSRQWFTDRARGFGPATEKVIAQILDRHVIETQGYLDCQNILDTLGKRSRQRLEAACQVLLNQNSAGRYSVLKRVMATVDSDGKAPRPVVPAAATLKPPPPSGARDDGAVQVRSADHYSRGRSGAGA